MAQVWLQWNPNSESDLGGYTLHAGTASGEYTVSRDVGNVTIAYIDVTPGQTWYFAAKAYNTNRQYSGYSNEVNAFITAPPAPVGFPTLGLLDTFPKDGDPLPGAWATPNAEYAGTGGRFRVLGGKLKPSNALGTYTTWTMTRTDQAFAASDLEWYLTIASYDPAKSYTLNVFLHDYLDDYGIGSYLEVVFNASGASTWALYHYDPVTHLPALQTSGTFPRQLATGDSIGFSLIAGTYQMYWRPGGGAWAALGSSAYNAQAATEAGNYAKLYLDGDDTSIEFDDLGGGNVSAPVVVGGDGAGLLDWGRLAASFPTQYLAGLLPILDYRAKTLAVEPPPPGGGGATPTGLPRTPIALLELDLDLCGRTFGVAPCTATGTPCYNTFGTCKATAAYLRQTKTYRYSSANAPVPWPGPRPYVQSIKWLPTEIKTSLAVTGRVQVELLDEPDADIGTDPYLAQRGAVPWALPGTYWKKLLARNPHHKGREARVYEGWLGQAQNEFTVIWVGDIEAFSFGRGVVKLEIADRLKKLAEIEVPAKLDIKLVIAIDAALTTITLTSVEGLAASGYVRIDDEILGYASLNDSTNQLVGCTRGANGTTADAHTARAKIQPCRYYPPANPFQILKDMLLTDAGLSGASVDSAAFDVAGAAGDWPPLTAVISEPTKLDELYFEIVDLIDCKSWVGEDLKVTIARNIPNAPGRTYATFTDAANLVKGSGQVDLNPKSRFSRVLCYWDHDVLGEVDKAASYGRLDMSVDANAEHANAYGEVVEKVIYSRWLHTGLIADDVMEQFVKALTLRRLWMAREPMPLVTFEVELKDAEIRTGGFVKLTTDELQTIAGVDFAGFFQVVRRERKAATVHLRVLQMPSRRFGFFAPDGLPEYANATEAQREYAFFTEADGTINGEPGYYFW